MQNKSSLTIAERFSRKRQNTTIPWLNSCDDRNGRTLFLLLYICSKFQKIWLVSARPLKRHTNSWFLQYKISQEKF